MKNIAIVDDHPLINLGMEVAVRRTVGSCHIHTATNLHDAISLLNHHKLDMMVLDLGIPGATGLKSITELLSVQPTLRILICSGRDELANAPACVRAGALGFLSKNASDDETRLAIATVIQGKKYISDTVRDQIVEQLLYGPSDQANPVDSLTRREKDVMDLLLKGYSSKAIGNQLKISFSTVGTHKQKIFQKVGVDNSLDLLKKVALYYPNYES